MRCDQVSRRDFMASAAALAATASFPRNAAAQAQSLTAALPARGEFVIRGAYVLTMDPAVPDLDNGIVHVRDGIIVAVGTSINAPDAEIIHGDDMICMPGLIDTHWHLWTSALRPLMRADDPKLGYFPVTSRLGPFFQPEDSYAGNLFGLAEALSAGVTTIHNWAHNVRSPAHADAELRAMREVGLRGRFAYGNPQGAPNTEAMDLADLARVKAELAKDRMLTLGICSRNVGADPNPMRGNITIDMAKKEWGGARELGLPITLHTSGPPVTKLLDDAELLGPDVQLVHPLNTSAEDRAILAKRGVSYSMSPIGESRRPGGMTQLAELLEAGVKVSLSTDHNTTYDCDLFGCMRLLYNVHQHRAANKFRITTKRMVEIATIDGARDLNLADKTGSITPGKRADLILVRTNDVNMAGMGDPYDALVQLAQPSNVDTVIVDGRVLRRNRRFLALDHPAIVRVAMRSAMALERRAKTP